MSFVKLFEQLLTFINAEGILAAKEDDCDYMEIAVEDVADCALKSGHGQALIKVVLAAAWKKTTPETRRLRHTCETFAKTGACDHNLLPFALHDELGDWTDGLCENCGYSNCSEWCQKDTRFWNPREMYMCEICHTYTCEIEKDEHLLSCNKEQCDEHSAQLVAGHSAQLVAGH